MRIIDRLLRRLRVVRRLEAEVALREEATRHQVTQSHRVADRGDKLVEDMKRANQVVKRRVSDH